MNSSKLIIADDFGFNHTNDIAMLDLCSAEKIDGVSVFPKYISEKHINSLLALRKNHGIKIGLHFNLTIGDHKQSLLSVQKLLMRSMLGLLDKRLIAEEFNMQLNIFKDKFNCSPDFIDGHEHVHAFPVIAKIICAKLNKIKYSGLVRHIGSRSREILLRSIRYNFFLKFITLEVLSINQRIELRKNNFNFNEKFDGLLPLNPADKILGILREIYTSEDLEPTLIM